MQNNQTKDIKILDTNIIFRATGETKQKAKALKSFLKVSSTSAVFRKLLDDEAAEPGTSQNKFT